MDRQCVADSLYTYKKGSISITRKQQLDLNSRGKHNWGYADVSDHYF